MKKILLFISAISAILMSSCSEDGESTYSYTYVTVSGAWQMHVTAHDGVSDSIIYSPQRMVNMTWSDMTYDSLTNVTTINSQVTIGNGVWRLTSLINGNGTGNYAMIDSSYATYTYTTKPNSHDSLNIVNYALGGTIGWVNSSDRYGNLNLEATAVNAAGEVVKFSGIVKSALAQKPDPKVEEKSEEEDNNVLTLE